MHSNYRLRVVLFSGVTLLGIRGALAQTSDFGVGIAGNSYWNTSESWANVTNNLSDWGTYFAPWLTTTLTYTADGYPLENASAMSSLIDYPDGVYQLSYTGDGTVGVNGIGQISNIVTTGNTTTAQVLITHGTGGLLSINLSNINASDPIDNLQLMAPGTQPGQLFTSTFLNRLAPVSTLRFMGWSNTNGNTDVNWSDRTSGQDVIQAGANGVSLEDEIALANQTGKNGWFNIPVGASDDYIKNMADLLHQTMASKETIYIEFSNELWNPGFPQYQTNLLAAEANPLLTGTNSAALAAQEDAYRTMQISQIFKQEFGDDDGRVKIVLSGQTSNSYVLSSGLQYLQSKYGNPSNYISDIAIAPYIDISNAQNVAGLTLDGLFADLNQQLPMVMAQVQQTETMAKQYGLTMTAYEGGQGLSSFNSNALAYVNQDLMEQAQNDPRMGQLTQQLMTDWAADGGGVFDYSALVFADDNAGFWGLLQDINQVGSPKWDAMLRSMLLLGDVNGDGVVDSADVAIILSNLGQSNMWYQQGDLNGDNVVNGDDMSLLDLGLAQQTQRTASVPEPGVCIAFFGGATLLGTRKRRRAI